MRTAPASGNHTTDGRPKTRTSITPHLVVASADDAMRFYADVLGARIGAVTRFGDAVAHAELDFGSGWLTMSEPMNEWGLVAPDPDHGVTYSLALYVPNVDEVVARAIEAGATLREPVTNFVSGDRFSSLQDPYGVRWSILTRVEDLSPEESADRVAAWAEAR